MKQKSRLGSPFLASRCFFRGQVDSGTYESCFLLMHGERESLREERERRERRERERERERGERALPPAACAYTCKAFSNPSAGNTLERFRLHLPPSLAYANICCCFAAAASLSGKWMTMEIRTGEGKDKRTSWWRLELRASFALKWQISLPFFNLWAPGGESFLRVTRTFLMRAASFSSFSFQWDMSCDLMSSKKIVAATNPPFREIAPVVEINTVFVGLPFARVSSYLFDGIFIPY